MEKLPVLIMLFIAAWFLWPESEPEEEWEPVGWTHKIDEAHVRVFWQDGDAATNQSFEEYWEESLFGDELWGWTAYDDPDYPDEFENGEYSCDFYLVEPEYVDDRYMAALGHEAYHCFRGDFHTDDSIMRFRKGVTGVDR